MKNVIIVTCALVLLASLSPQAPADIMPLPKVDYSADTVMTVDGAPGGGPMTIQGKIHYSKGDERREIEMMGQRSVVIRKQQKDVTWILMPEQQMYMESSHAQDKGQKDPAKAWRDTDLEMTREGSETINGVNAEKYRIVATEPDGTTTEGFVWLTREHIPVKMEGSNSHRGRTTNFSMEYSNLRIGKQDPQLFAIPSGYKKFQMPTMGGPMMAPETSFGTMQPDAPPQDPNPLDMSPEKMEQFQKQMEEQMEQLRKQMQQAQ